MNVKLREDYIPAALYARVSSDRQDVDLSVAAQLRALRDYADNNGYMVVREYIDEAESGRIADRPQFRKMLDDAGKSRAPFQDLGLEVLPLHSQTRTRSCLQVDATQTRYPGDFDHRTRRLLSYGQAHGGNHRERRRVLQ